MKNTIAFIALFLCTMGLVAQENGEKDGKWTKGGQFNLNFSQIALQNWAAGGENSMTGVAMFNAFANYSEGNISWDNTLNLGYGLLKQDDEDWYKSEDKLQFSSKYGRKTNSNWYYSGLVDFKTQFTKGYLSSTDTDHSSSFFAPAYLNLAIGMDYKPNDNFSVMIAPISGKFTFVGDTALSNNGDYGVDEGEAFRAELGAYVKVMYKVNIMENVAYETTLDLFSNYLDKPQNIDINWDNMLSFTINKYLQASLMFNLIYDDDIKFDIDEDDDGVVEKSIAQLQLKEMFALGFAYKF